MYDLHCSISSVTYYNKIPFYASSNEYIDRIEEQEADEFSTDALIPRDNYNDFAERGYFIKASICDFGEMISIHPRIVLGML